MGEIVNPYIAGAPIAEQRMFFGREDIFRWIETSISGQYADHILVIHGQRRVGKTSVLKQLGNRLPDRYIPVFFDLQGRTHTTLDRFLWWLAREIVRVLKQERGIEVSLPEKDDFARDPEHFENRFLPDLKPVLAGRSLLLTFDEFDNLEESEVREDLARPLVDYLRRLMGREGLNFIFSIGSSGRKLENMQAAYTDFFKVALYKKISFLDEEQTRHLVTSPVEGVLTYTHEAVGRIYALASGHPYFTQLTCHELFARCQRTEQREITRDDVEAVLDDVVERGTVNLKFVWDESSDIEKWCLAALAHVQKTDLRTLTDYLRKNRVRFTDSDLTSGLLHLREKDVLTPDNRFVVQLLQRWLQKNRPIEQVREELTEVNPIANRYLEIGLEFKDAKLYDKAINSFQEALGIARENIQAQVNIALTYMDQKMYDKAVVEFEKALTMDDEDVAARTGLCEAHLALGDAAMSKNRTKDAVLSYQRVLVINAEHTEARGRMAELSSRRAEKALAEGKDEAALSAFAEALRFTPEDPALIERVEKVRAEKNAKVLAAQVARSEKEAAIRNWEAAIAALNEALEIAPGDESILKKIADIKAKQLQERLDAILLKVDAAEKAGRWDGAIAGLNEYLRFNPDAAIQKRIAALVEAKHTAWLKSVMERVDRAVAAQNWDEALTALNEALRLEPDNAEMQAKVEEMREARRIAELESMLQRAGQAVNAGHWDEAIDILNNGLASDPDNEMLKTKLEEARKSKREARLKAALRLADASIQAGNWDTAAASLQEVLANEPDNAEFQQKLAEIKRLERESRLNTLRAQAQDFLRAEQFKEALEAWKAYLALEPEDREKAQAEIEAVKQAQILASLYAEGTKAYTKKNYEKAIDLFKRIVVADAEYKDATDLLAESVRLRRAGQKSPRVFNRKAWLTGGLVTVLALGIGGGLFWLGKNGLPAMTAVITNTPASTLDPTPITTPDPRMVNSTNQHLYLFVKLEKNWHDARDYCAAQGGYLATIQGAAENDLVADLLDGNAWLGATDEVEEGDWAWVSGEPWGYTNWNNDSNQPDNDQGQEHYLEFEVRSSPLLSVKYSDWNDKSGEEKNFFVCEWDPETPALDPAVQVALDKIRNEEPLYQTSFDSWDFGASHGIVRMENGKLLVNSEDQEHAGVIMQKLISDRYAVEFEFRILESSPVGHCIFETANNYDSEAPSWRAMNAGFLSNGKAILGYYVHPNQIKDFVESTTEFDSSSARKVTLIIIGDRTAVFIDGSYAFTAVDPSGSVQYVFESLSANYTAQCEYDNFKIWDLSELASVSLIPEVRVAPKDGMLMRYVPAGSFVMGSDMGAGNEKPAHDVYLDSFWIDQTEITNEMYSLCETAGDCPAPKMPNSYSRSSYYGNDEFANYPVIYVDWDMASAYCAWADRRLPTEAEWEKAARGTTGYIYPWGGDAVCENVNAMGCKGETSPVGEYVLGKSPYGLFDMAGNVMEWVADWYDSEYYQYSPRENPLGPSTGSRHVLRGGSWKSNEFSLRSTFRSGLVPDEANLYLIGFRCAQGINP